MDGHYREDNVVIVRDDVLAMCDPQGTTLNTPPVNLGVTSGHAVYLPRGVPMLSIRQKKCWKPMWCDHL